MIDMKMRRERLLLYVFSKRGFQSILRIQYFIFSLSLPVNLNYYDADIYGNYTTCGRIM